MAVDKRSPGKELPLSQATSRHKGSFIIYVRNGVTIAAAWPKKRTKPFSEAEKIQQAEFKALAEATKFVTPGDAVTAREIAQNSKHTWRDILSRMMIGTLVEVEPYGMAIAQYNLDLLSNTPGSMVFRATEGWDGLMPGTQYDVLQMIDGFPVWQPLSFEPLGSVNGMIARRASGAWSGLSPGSADELLTMVAGLPEWRALNLDVFGSVDGSVLRRASGEWSALSPGSASQILTIVSGVPEWRDLNLDAYGTTTGALLRRISTGWQVLAPGSAGEVLTVFAGLPAWQAPSFEGLGSTNGMIARRAAGAWGGLAIGSTGDVLTVSGGLPTWQAPSFEGLGSSDGMIARRAAGAWSGLAIGSTDQVLTVSSGLPVWQSLSTLPAPTWSGSTTRLVSNVTPVGLPGGTTAQQDLQTYSLPAATLSANGNSLEIYACGTALANAHSKSLRINFGASQTGFNLTTTSQIAWEFRVRLTRTGATTQILTGLQFMGTNAGITNQEILRTNPTETLSGAVTIKTTGATNVATADDIISQVLTVDLIR